MVKHVPPLKWETKEVTLEIDGVPTVEGLLAMNLARRTSNGIQISRQGHALMGKRLRENAEAFQEKGLWRGTSGVHTEVARQPGL